MILVLNRIPRHSTLASREYIYSSLPCITETILSNACRLTSYGVGLVLRSENPDIKVGEHIAGLINFQQYSVITDLKLSRVMVITKTEESIPWSAYVGVLGMPGEDHSVMYFELHGCPFLLNSS